MSTLHVLFRVGESDYVLPADKVVQMDSYQGATHVPGAAAHVAGVVQVRGRVIPVVDLRKRFGLDPVVPSLDTRLVVVMDGERHVGLIADLAREVVRIDESTFHDPPEAVSAQAQGFVNSIAQTGDRLVMRLDFDKVIGNQGIPLDAAAMPEQHDDDPEEQSNAKQA